MDLENKIIIDWFSFTTSICSPQNIIELLGMEDKYGFRKQNYN
nr:MAG TPA: Rolling Circle replication initiation protein [Inoviridae sp.]